MTVFFGFLHHLVFIFSDLLRETYCAKLRVAGIQNNSVTLKMQAIRTSETPENITITRYINRQDDHHLSQTAVSYG
jgi:hypothetical protein